MIAYQWRLRRFSVLALEFVFVGSSNGEIAETILQTLIERESKFLDEK